MNWVLILNTFHLTLKKMNINLAQSLWRNRLARSAVNRKVGGSNPPRDEFFF